MIIREKKSGTSLTFPLLFFLPPAVCTFIVIYSFLANWILLSWPNVSTQHVGWMWWISGITGLYLWCDYNHNSPVTAYCRVKLSEIYSAAGTKPLDFVIIHWPKSPPCTHCAIFIPHWMYFFSYITAQAWVRDFLSSKRVLVYQMLVKCGKWH